MSETLKHYARGDFAGLDRDYDYSRRRVRDDKPTGFWVSVQGPDDWYEWCTREEFCVSDLSNEYDVTLAPGANVLRIDNLGDLEDLTYRYPALTAEWRRSSVWADERYPDWPRIAAEFDGIIIAPYQWAARLDLFWYYAWDCASGCIWNLDAIESVTPARKLERAS